MIPVKIIDVHDNRFLDRLGDICELRKIRRIEKNRTR